MDQDNPYMPKGPIPISNYLGMQSSPMTPSPNPMQGAKYGPYSDVQYPPRGGFQDGGASNLPRSTTFNYPIIQDMQGNFRQITKEEHGKMLDMIDELGKVGISPDVAMKMYMDYLKYKP